MSMQLDIRDSLLLATNWRARIWLWVYSKVLPRNAIAFRFPNITMEPGESLIIHSPAGADIAVGIKLEQDGTLIVLLDPPSIKAKRVEIRRTEGEKAIFLSQDIIPIEDR